MSSLATSMAVTDGRKVVGDVGDVLEGVGDLGASLGKVSAGYTKTAGKLADSPILAAAPGRGSDGKVVFSLSDGTVIAPELDGNAKQATTVVYPGGFATEIAVTASRDEVQFFDNTGKRTSSEGIRGLLNTHSLDLPMVNSVKDGWAVYTSGGEKLLAESGDAPFESHLIGNRFFVKDPADTVVSRWQQYDMQTGAEGKVCNFNMGSGYLATDGTTALFEGGNANVGLTTKAVDLTTCDTLWTLSSAVGSFRNVWRVDTTLVQLSDDGTELVSLVAPS
jgi:hypothetical protein